MQQVLKSKVTFLFFVCLIALYLRLLFPQTIEFGYDQPRLASVVLKFISQPSFTNVQAFVEQNPWGSYSWGMWQIVFWVPFFLLSVNPVVLSQLVSVVGVIGIFVYGVSFLSIPGGLFASLLLATHFWVHIFAREVYQPTPVVFVTILVMALSVASIGKRRQVLSIVLLPLLGILVSIYISTILWVGVTFVVLVLSKVYTKKTFAIGAILTLAVLSPTIWFHLKHPETFDNYYAHEGFSTPTIIARVSAVPQYLSTISGGNIVWQIGNGTEEFLLNNPWYWGYERIQWMLALFVLLYHLYQVMVKKERLRLMFLLWALSPLLFALIVGFPDIVPRYFLVGIPAYISLLAWMLQERIKKQRMIFCALIIALASMQSIVILRYYEFALTYTYPYGFMSYFSDTPIVFLERSLDWVKKDAAVRGDGYTIESSINAVNYYTENIVTSQGLPKTLYTIEYKNDKTQATFVSGPYAVTRL